MGANRVPDYGQANPGSFDARCPGRGAANEFLEDFLLFRGGDARALIPNAEGDTLSFARQIDPDRRPAGVNISPHCRKGSQRSSESLAVDSKLG